uniref:choice-of-anchor L domain-containing protein n=1 Tax=Flavobacterium sp. TaxID=239 RepID=UPI003750BB1B
MKRILLLFLILLFNFSFSQLSVNNTTQTPAQLVQNVLLGSGITVSNVKFNGSAANALLIRDQVGHFTNGVSTNLGIDSGIILATGQAQAAIGPNNAGGLTLATANPITGDSDLALLTTNTINNKAILEFDFVPIGQNLSFNFVFASEEYPEWTNTGFNDVFGFFLSGPGITGPYTGGAANIALIPSTIVPITINNLNNGGANLGPCEYCAFYVNNGTGVTPALNATIQYDGFTTVIAANAIVQCGMTYHIKLAIANVGDNSLDSAVFLQAQSFNTNPLSFPNDYLISNGFAPCAGTTTTINTGLPITVLHSWTLNGNLIVGETGPIITISQPGLYCATAYPYGPACPVTDCITVEFQPPLPVNPPNNLIVCSSPFNLTLNTPVVLGALSPSLFDVNYFLTSQNAEDFASAISSPNVFNGTNGQIIYIRVDDSSGSNCYSIQSFTLTIDPVQCLVNANQPPNLSQCDDASNDGFGTFDFTPQTAIVLGSQSASSFTVTYHLTQATANSDSGAISPFNSFVNTVNPQIIYVRIEDNANPTFYDTTTFQLIVNAIPSTPNPADVTVCGSYILPTLPAGSTYHSASGGTGTTFANGATINSTQTIYVYAQTGTT